MKFFYYFLIISIIFLFPYKSTLANKIIAKNNDMIIVETKKHWLGTKRELNRVFSEAYQVGVDHCKKFKKKSYIFYRRNASTVVAEDSDNQAVDDLWNSRVRVFCAKNESELLDLFEEHNEMYDYYSALNLSQFRNAKLWAWDTTKQKWVKLEKKEVVKKEEKKKNNVQEKEGDKIFSVSSGSGFFINNNGYIISNNHVIDSCNEVRVHYFGKSYPSTVIARDRANDLALLNTNINPKNIFTISNSDASIMEDIYVSGFPFGKNISNSLKVTKGIVSSLVGIGDNYSNLQIDAALQPGSSGGPIVNSKGYIVGVAVAKLDFVKIIEMFDTLPENTNFGIKSSVLKTFITANGIDFKSQTQNEITREELSKVIANGTVYIDCWMTEARVKNLSSRKVLFEQFNK